MRGLVPRLLKRQVKLPLCGRCLARLGLDRIDGSINAKRFQERSTSVPTAASMLKPLIEMQRSVPWFVRAPWQL